jgi:uncharacterized repeat protein (TIGR03837 family)
MRRRWDIFCTVVDNLGDIGVSWRLARQLVHEYQLEVRLWVDDLGSLAHIAPEIVPGVPKQSVQGVEVCHWQQPFVHDAPADVVIEAFACELPEVYIAAMAQQAHQPVWINLEYLSAEDWVPDYHGLSSPHPRLPLVKTFFFPGFVQGTGGLLREKNLLTLRDAFDEKAVREFCHRYGIPKRQPDEFRISLFCYDSAPLDVFVNRWVNSETPVFLLVPQGTVADKLCVLLGAQQSEIDKVLRSGQLSVQVIPFLEQTEYDRLLWICDFNFVRGEDSLVRAQWANRPFVWHIYAQQEGAHWAKLEAFLKLYTAEMSPEMATLLRALWYAWNGKGDLDSAAWLSVINNRIALEQHQNTWVMQLQCQIDLAANLVRFIRNRI